jgi:hypothetical protein
MADASGDPATSAVRMTGVLSLQHPCGCAQPLSPGKGVTAKQWVRVSLLVALLLVLAACGVQAPPLPPRLQVPEQIKNLSASQTGRTIHVTFTVPALAADGERLSKPVEINIFRAIEPAGQKPTAPDTSVTPWLSLTAHELPRYTQAGKVDVPLQISPQDFRRQQGSTFAFAVVAFTRGFRGRQHKSAPSNVAHAPLLDVTTKPTDLAVSVTQTAVLLTWVKPTETLTGLPPAHPSGYRIYQSVTGKPGSFKLLGESATARFEDRNFQFGQQYYFRVSAVAKANGTVAESDPSAPVGVTPRDIFPPPVPTGLTAVNAAGAVDLLWNASAANDLAGYNVYRSTAGGAFERINKQLLPTPIFHDSSAAPGQHYQYAVTAVDLSGNESARSQPASVATGESSRN